MLSLVEGHSPYFPGLENGGKAYLTKKWKIFARIPSYKYDSKAAKLEFSSSSVFPCLP